MPKWNLGELMSRATAGIGRRADIAQSDASFWANEAYHRVSEHAPHALQERIAVSSTTSGENKVDLPSDFNEMISLSNLSSNQTLRQIRDTEIDNEDPDSLGEPAKYTLYNNWLELQPSPDSSYSLQIRYKSFTTDLTSTSDVPSVATPWRLAIMKKTQEFLLSEVKQDPQEAAAKRNEYLSLVNTLDDDYAKRQKASREAFGVSPYLYEAE